MVFIRLWGGLGNQLFQYSFGYAMAKRKNTDLVLDCSFYDETYLAKNPRFTRQKPLILESNLDCVTAQPPTNASRRIQFLQGKNTNRIIRLPRHFSFLIDKGFRYVKETRPRYDSALLKVYGDESVYYDGYWQCEKYFKDYRAELLQQLTPARDVSAYGQLYDRIVQDNSVAIHIRRGDYAGSKFNSGNLHILPMEYYDNAIQDVRKKIQNPRFFVFSNDIEWVKAYFGQREDLEYVSGTDCIDTMDEFFLMCNCQHQIIANSTFSWWAAWLNKNENKKVWAPDQWFGNKDIIAEGWITIS